ncbi:zinc-binding dehydrogenase [Thozetella sp. PMI_491]|nr:zinc-binding dehydrogenase [Thozetella sp. PMI_491]
MALMRAVDIKGGKGPASSLFLSPNVPRPVPAHGEALIRVKFFGLNRMDLTQRAGNYPIPPRVTSILGVEFSGTIEEVADDNDDSEYKIGDEVFGLAYGGAYAEYIAVSTRMIIRKPKTIPWEVAAGIPETWITALQVMYMVAKFAPGKSILWHAGSSSVSLAGIQLSKAHGASAIYTTVGSREKADLCISVGATTAWNYKDEDWAAELDRATGGLGVDIIVDFVGADYFQRNLDSTALDGEIVIVGLLSGNVIPAEIDISAFVRRRIKVEGTRLRSRELEYQGRLQDLLVREALPGLADGRFRVPIDKIFDWGDISKAHEMMEGNRNKGKIICKVA